MIRKLFATDDSTATTILRLVLGLVFFAHGAQKMLGWFGSAGFKDTMRTMHQFLEKQGRPTAGCELVSSRNFPDDTQGDYLLNNDIGFQGVLRYRMKDDGSGFKADVPKGKNSSSG